MLDSHRAKTFEEKRVKNEANALEKKQQEELALLSEEERSKAEMKILADKIAYQKAKAEVEESNKPFTNLGGEIIDRLAKPAPVQSDDEEAAEAKLNEYRLRKEQRDATKAEETA